MKENNLCRIAQNGKALQIFTPFTPTTWANKLFNDEFQIDVSQRLEGKASTVGERFEHSLFLHPDTRFYIRVNGDAKQMCKGEGEQFLCTHSISESVVSERFGDIESEILTFVPTKGKKCVWSATFTNLGQEEAEVDFFSVFHFATEGWMTFGSYYDERYFGMYCTGFPYYVKYEDMESMAEKNRVKYVLSSEKPFSYEGNANRFWGCDDYSRMPKAVLEGACRNLCCEQEEPYSILHHKITLAKGESKQIHFVCGLMTSVDDLSEEYRYLSNIEEEYQKNASLWEERTKKFIIQTPDEDVDAMMNYWLKKQLTYFVRLNRGGVYCPIRNQLQDLLGYSLLDPEAAFEYLLPIIRLQHLDGYIKQYYCTNGGPDTQLSLLKHSDAYVWLVMCTVEVIENTGRKELYDYKVGYKDSPVQESLLVHLRKAAYYMLTQMGEHGLCLMLDGDWNDPVNGPGHLGKGESTWNSMALIYAIDRLNEVEYDKTLAERSEMLKDAINEHCWDEDRYIAGFDDDGNPYGCRMDEEANKFLNAQTWAIISKVATGDRLHKVVETIESMKNAFGYVLIDPIFTKYNPTWGRVSLKTGGTTENGSVYNHAVMFKAYADCVRGDAEATLETIRLTLPTEFEKFPKECLGFPMFYSNYYFGAKGDNYGRSSQHYRTGTVAWSIWLVVKELFGIKISSKGTNLQPNLPDSWDNAEMRFHFGNKEYLVTKSDGEVRTEIV